MVDYTKEYKAIVDAYKKAGGNSTLLKSNKVASIVINKDRVLGINEISGVRIKFHHIEDGVEVRLVVEKGVRLEFPVHLCFGMLPKEGVQIIKSHFLIEKGAKAKFLAHCIFPNAVKVRHIMDSRIDIKENGSMEYTETHFHGQGGVEVIPKTIAKLGKGAKFTTEFRTIQGRVGLLDIDYKAYLGEKAVAELLTKVYGKGEDRIKVKESLYLEGESSRGLAKSRIVVQDRARSEVRGEAIGKGPYSRGHVDCMEVIKGEEAVATAIPKVEVLDERAKVTHEAAIGSIDKKEIETLMARGLTENEAVDIIVKGILK